jgi:hypothetical protein
MKKVYILILESNLTNSKCYFNRDLAVLKGLNSKVKYHIIETELDTTESLIPLEDEDDTISIIDKNQDSLIFNVVTYTETDEIPISHNPFTDQIGFEECVSQELDYIDFEGTHLQKLDLSEELKSEIKILAEEIVGKINYRNND